MHCDLARHRGTHYTPRQQSELFLKNITDERYHGLANNLLLLLSDKPDNVTAPYRIPALLDRLVDTSAADVLDGMDLPGRSAAVNMTSEVAPPRLHTTNDDANDATLSAEADVATPHVQGFVHRLAADRSSHRGKPDRFKPDRGKSDDR